MQAWLVRQAVRLQKTALLFTDERSKLEGELLNGIDVVKCNSWEVHAPRGAVLAKCFWLCASSRTLLPAVTIMAACHVAPTLPCGLTACSTGLSSGYPRTLRIHLCHGLAAMAARHKPLGDLILQYAQKFVWCVGPAFDK